MKESEQIAVLNKNIKNLQTTLEEKVSQLGEAIYDSDYRDENITQFLEIDELESKIPEIKEQLDRLKSYSLSIEEANKELKECQKDIKDIEDNLGPVFEKIGVELYCFIGEKELSNSTINSIYQDLKEGELKSETLENRLYSYENSAAKKSVLNIFSKPFKVHGIKKDIKQNNRASLKKFRELGQIYCESPELVDEHTNESLLDVLEEYKKRGKQLKRLRENIVSLENRIKEKENKIEEESKGVKLKSLYQSYEDEIVETQNQISLKMSELGKIIVNSENHEFSDETVKGRLTECLDIENSISRNIKELSFWENKIKLNNMDKEINYLEDKIEKVQENIEQLQAKLESHKNELEDKKSKRDDLDKWLTDNKV